MSAFDPTSNTGSTTFTNAFGTIDLLPSAGLQHVHGYQRTSGWRYWEAKIEDQGGDNSKLFVGYALSPIGTPPTETVWGDNSSQASILSHNALTLTPGAIPATASLTAETGDVFMFAADLSGSARDHAGVAQVTGTISTGTGVTMHPNYIEVGKNGVWMGVGVVGWEWASGGYPMKAWPVVTRDSTSASFARVSLRVVTNSFAYAIPTGMVAWGDGPEGTLVAGDDATIIWDVTKTSAGMSLSGGSLYAVEHGDLAGGFKSDYVMSTILPTTGKRYFELFFGSSTTTYSYDATEWNLSLVDANASITCSDDTAPKILMMPGVLPTEMRRRGTNISASVTNPVALNPNNDLPFMGMMVDFDNSRAWFMRPAAASGLSQKPWTGDKQAGSSVFPYSWGATSSTDGLTVSFSVGSRIGLAISQVYFHSPSEINAKLNVSGPFTSYPLLPGAKSMNGGRSVQAGWGGAWDTVNNPASMTYGAANLVVLSRTAPALAQITTVRSSGKYYFEIYKETDGASATMDFCFGVRLQDATTVTNVSIANLLDQGLFFCNMTTTGRQSRYNAATLTWSATGSYGSSGGRNRWQALAIDFDAGKIWGGTWQNRSQTMFWGAGSDPATGTGAHMTFTASTTMRPCVSWLTTAAVQDRTVFVADDNNVIGLPSGFTTWNGTAPVSVTATPSGTVAAGGVLNIWPFGIVT